MKQLAIFVCLSLAVVAVQGKEGKGKTWALLVASANGWVNYGMQADVYHAYQVFRQGGIPEDQIVVMAYDDIARDRENPFQGQVFQSYDLNDVYKGLVIDYKGTSVNKKVFASVLKGDSDAVRNLTGRTGKVIDSGPDDNVFVFISNHGGPGIVCWWDGDDMSGRELNDTITTLHTQNRYKNLVFYLDTCFAGSMFENILPHNIGVYAVTATNATWYAWSADCNSKAFSTSVVCLGGLFSINWVYELQSDDRLGSNLNMQFHEAKTACRGQAIPKQYGDRSIGKLKQVEIFGDSSLNRKPMQSKRYRRSTENQSVVPKHMLVYHTLKNQLNQVPEGSRESSRIATKLSNVETLMGHSDQFIQDVARSVHSRFAKTQYLAWAETNFGPINWSCYEPVVESIRSLCPGMMRVEEVRYYTGAKFGVLVNLCNEVRSDNVLAAVKAAAKLNPLCDV